MKEEIRKLFPLEFYINENGKMCSEISLENLNKIVEEIVKLNNIINELEEYLIDMFNKTQNIKYCDDLIKFKELKEGK